MRDLEIRIEVLKEQIKAVRRHHFESEIEMCKMQGELKALEKIVNHYYSKERLVKLRELNKTYDEETTRLAKMRNCRGINGPGCYEQEDITKLLKYEMDRLMLI